MANPVWGLLQKSLTDSTTIETRVDEKIAEHEADEDSHLGVGESLQSHKAAVIIDHLAESIITDKLADLAVTGAKITNDQIVAKDIRTAADVGVGVDGVKMVPAGIEMWQGGVQKVKIPVTGNAVFDGDIKVGSLEKKRLVFDSLFESLDGWFIGTDVHGGSVELYSVGQVDLTTGNQIGDYAWLEFYNELLALSLNDDDPILDVMLCHGEPTHGDFVIDLDHKFDMPFYSDIGFLWDASLGKLFACKTKSFPDTIYWGETRPAGDVNKNWRSVATSYDGKNLIAASYGGRLWTSSDGGCTWIERRPIDDNNYNWFCVASNITGSYLVAGISVGRMYRSVNYGVTWSEIQPKGNAEGSWYSVAVDYDGSNLIAVEYNGRVWTSSDFGVNWTERRPAGDFDKVWYCCASDQDGSFLMVGAVGGRLWTSSNSGANWTERQPAGNVDKNWRGVCCDTIGTNMYAIDYGGRVWYSANGGTSWTDTKPAGDVNKNWMAIACDWAGSYPVVLVDGGRVYRSQNFGVNWDEEKPAGDSNKWWRSVAVDYDGSNTIVAVDGGRVYASSGMEKVEITGVDMLLIHRFRFEKYSDRIDFYVDGVLKCSITDELPTVLLAVGASVGLRAIDTTKPFLDVVNMLYIQDYHLEPY